MKKKCAHLSADCLSADTRRQVNQAPETRNKQGPERSFLAFSRTLPLSIYRLRVVAIVGRFSRVPVLPPSLARPAELDRLKLVEGMKITQGEMKDELQVNSSSADACNNKTPPEVG